MLSLIFLYLNSIKFMLVSSQSSTSSLFSLFKINDQKNFTVSLDFENYALIHSVQQIKYMSLIGCISYFELTYISRAILYTISNSYYSCKVYQYVPNNNTEVIASSNYSKLLIKKGIFFTF